MSEEHHQVRYFVVRELPSRGEPIEPESISRALQLPLVRVESILMKVSIHDEDASPLVFMPQVDWKTLAEPNIINAY
jgi:hypothetical protein